MIKADKAEVTWDEEKKKWLVRISVGEEVLRRYCKDANQDTPDDKMRAIAIATAADDGYELPADTVTVTR
jgi:hypothetical protein